MSGIVGGLSFEGENSRFCRPLCQSLLKYSPKADTIQSVGLNYCSSEVYGETMKTSLYAILLLGTIGPFYVCVQSSNLIMCPLKCRSLHNTYACVSIFRTFPMDMAGFVINIAHFLDKPDVKMGFTTQKGRRVPVKDGHLETDYLGNFATRDTVECRGSNSEVMT